MHLEKKWNSHSYDESVQIGREIAGLLSPGDLLLVYGELGAGKTSLLTGLISELTGLATLEITSPTFACVQTYEGRAQKVHHFDLYRLKSQEEIYTTGFIDYLEEEAICCIEWPELIESTVKERVKLLLKIEHVGTEERKITLVKERE